MELQTFNNDQFGMLRTIEIENKIYYCGNDVAKALGYKNPQKAIKDHCKLEGVTNRSVGVITGNKVDGTPATQNVEMKFITEGNVYRLIARSKLPQAEKFESWVFDEVLPQIAHTGAYAMTTEEKVLLSLQYSKEISDRVNTVEEIALETKEDVDQLKNNMVIDRSQKHQLLKAKDRMLVAVCGGNKRMPAYKCKELTSKVARTMWRQYWDHFDIASYEDTPAVRYDEAKEYIEQWLPDNNLRLEVARVNQGDANVD